MMLVEIGAMPWTLMLLIIGAGHTLAAEDRFPVSLIHINDFHARQVRVIIRVRDSSAVNNHHNRAQRFYQAHAPIRPIHIVYIIK